MSMDGEILQRLADHEARLKALEIRAGLRRQDGSVVAAIQTDAPMPETIIINIDARSLPEIVAKYRHL